MNLKKFYGPSVQKAREKARATYGDDVVILESVQPGDDGNAMVTVMTPKGDGNGSKPDKKLFTYGRKQVKNRESDGAGSNGKGKRPSLTKGERSPEGLDQLLNRDKNGGKDQKSSHFDHLISNELSKPPVEMSRRSNSIFSSNNGGNEPGNGTVSNNDLQWNHVQRRLATLESLLSEYLISVNIDFVTHPLFQQLLSNGVDVVTISQWINEAISAGSHPTDGIEAFTLKMQSIIENSLTNNKEMKEASHLAFIGPSGVGKTAMVMKLAANPDIYKGKKVALVSVEPFHNYPENIKLRHFAQEKNIPFFRVSNNAQMSHTLQKLKRFDIVLYDTPAQSIIPGKAFQQFWKIRQALASVQPLDIHLVINTTLERRYLKEISSAEYPLDPDYLCLTHTDEVRWWGHVLPLIKRLNAGIRYLSTGPHLVNDIKKFDASWFAQKMMNNMQRYN